MSGRALFRYEVPVDDEWHALELRGPVVHVDTRGHLYIEFWVMHDDAAAPQLRAFRVFGTGQPIPPAAATYVGTAVTPDGGRFAWHLMEHADPQGAS